MSRIFTQVNENYDLYRLALAFICTTRGVPQIFYGTEILMKNPGTDAHTVIRSDFPGGWEGDMVNAFTGHGLTPEQRDAHEFVRHLLQWRKQNSVIHHGRLMHFSPKDKVYVFFRYDEKNKVMVILNKNTEEYTLDLAPFSEMLDGAYTGTDVIDKTKYNLQGSIVLKKAGPVILELKK
jgi:glycosidase